MSLTSQAYDDLRKALDSVLEEPTIIFTKELETLPEGEQFITLHVNKTSVKNIDGNKYFQLEGHLLKDFPKLMLRTGSKVIFSVNHNAYSKAITKYLKYERLDIKILEQEHIEVIERVNARFIKIKKIVVK